MLHFTQGKYNKSSAEFWNIYISIYKKKIDVTIFYTNMNVNCETLCNNYVTKKYLKFYIKLSISNGSWHNFTVILPRPWKFPFFVSLTGVDANFFAFVGKLHAAISTETSPSDSQSWISTNMFSVAPTRNKLGADKTFLLRKKKR